MADIEQRLKALEKRAIADDERWRMLDAHTKATEMIRQAIVAPICVQAPALIPVIIKSLRALEDEARRLNAHAKTIVEVRAARQFFEKFAKKAKPNPGV